MGNSCRGKSYSHRTVSYCFVFKDKKAKNITFYSSNDAEAVKHIAFALRNYLIGSTRLFDTPVTFEVLKHISTESERVFQVDILMKGTLSSKTYELGLTNKQTQTKLQCNFPDNTPIFHPLLFGAVFCDFDDHISDQYKLPGFSYYSVVSCSRSPVPSDSILVSDASGVRAGVCSTVVELV